VRPKILLFLVFLEIGMLWKFNKKKRLFLVIIQDLFLL